MNLPPANNTACIQFQEYVEEACDKGAHPLNTAIKIIAYPAIFYAGSNIADGIIEGGICVKELIKKIKCEKERSSDTYEMIDPEGYEFKTQTPRSVPLWKRGIHSIKNLSKGTATLAVCYLALEAIGTFAIPTDHSGQGGCYQSGLRANQLCNIANDFLVNVIWELFTQSN